MTGAGVPVVAQRVMSALIPPSATVRAAGISAKADKQMAEFDAKAWDDYQQRLFAHLDARGLLDVYVQAVRGSLTVISNRTPTGEGQVYLWWDDGPSSWSKMCLLPVWARTTTWLDPEGSIKDISIEGSDGVARILFDSPAAREL